jgi:hypothetical protein
MKTAEQIALWADRLRDLSAMGLTFAENAIPDDLHPETASRVSAAYRVWKNQDRAYFDRPSVP